MYVKFNIDILVNHHQSAYDIWDNNVAERFGSVNFSF